MTVPGLRTQGERVVRRTLQLARILDEDHALVARGHLNEQCIHERRLAGARAARDQDVPFFRDRTLQKCTLKR